MKGRKPGAGNVIAGPFAGVAVKLTMPNWLLRFQDGKWGQQRARIAGARWKMLIASMTAKQTLDRDNGVAIEMAAAAYADWKLAEAHVAQFGPIVASPKTGVPMHNPYKAIADAAMKRCQAIERDLGIPPVERGRATKVKLGRKNNSRPADSFLRPASGAE
jgi:phage terminase small subunit